MRLTLLYLTLLLLQGFAASAQEASTPPTTAPATVTTVTPLPELQSPRATLQTFLRAMRDQETPLAISCLDLGRLTKEAAATSGQNVAYQLHEVIKHLTNLSLEEEYLWSEVPDANDHGAPFSLGTLLGSHPDANQLVLRRNSDDGNWRFSQETCDAVDELYNQLEQLPTDLIAEDADEVEIEQPLAIRLRSLFPLALRNTTFLLPDYQWICLLALIFIGLLMDILVRWLLSLIISHLFGTYVEDDELDARARIWKPVGRLANAATWYWGTKIIGLPPTAMNVLLIGLKLFTVVASVWTAFAIIDMIAKYLARQALRTQTKFDDLLVPLVSKSLKVLAVSVAILTAAQTFEIPILGLVGGLGLGGAALAFASKDAVANFFGSLTVLLDRPFEVGDWIVTEGAEGTVETVGFRSTRIRTFYNSLITLPNSHLTTAAVDNMGRRRYRRIKTTIGVQYDTTPDQLEAFCEGIRELIRRHPNTRKDFFHVYFNDFGPSSLDIMLYCFVQCPDWAAELQSRHRLLSDIVRLADKLDVQFAFPTRTIHMAPDDPGDTPSLPDEPQQVGKQVAEAICLRTT